MQKKVSHKILDNACAWMHAHCRNALKEQAAKFGCLVHAYILMTNHVHLLLTPEKEGSASLLMKHLGQRYVQYMNRTYKLAVPYGKG
jgi:REP element-mobilizing transposase RayT